MFPSDPMESQSQQGFRWLCNRLSSGNITDEVIAAYIENQNEEDDGDFRVEGEERE
jgi:hypothetical protein